MLSIFFGMCFLPIEFARHAIAPEYTFCGPVYPRRRGESGTWN